MRHILPSMRLLVALVIVAAYGVKLNKNDYYDDMDFALDEMEDRDFDRHSDIFDEHLIEGDDFAGLHPDFWKSSEGDFIPDDKGIQEFDIDMIPDTLNDDPHPDEVISKGLHQQKHFENDIIPTNPEFDIDMTSDIAGGPSSNDVDFEGLHQHFRKDWTSQLDPVDEELVTSSNNDIVPNPDDDKEKEIVGLHEHFQPNWNNVFVPMDSPDAYRVTKKARRPKSDPSVNVDSISYNDILEYHLANEIKPKRFSKTPRNAHEFSNGKRSPDEMDLNANFPWSSSTEEIASKRNRLDPGIQEEHILPPTNRDITEDEIKLLLSLPAGLSDEDLETAWVNARLAPENAGKKIYSRSAEFLNGKTRVTTSKSLSPGRTSAEELPEPVSEALFTKDEDALLYNFSGSLQGNTLPSFWNKHGLSIYRQGQDIFRHHPYFLRARLEVLRETKASSA